MDASNSNLLDWIEKGQNKLKKITKNNSTILKLTKNKYSSYLIPP